MEEPEAELFLCLMCKIELCKARKSTEVQPFCEDCALKVYAKALRETENAIYDKLLKKD